MFEEIQTNLFNDTQRTTATKKLFINLYKNSRQEKGFDKPNLKGMYAEKVFV